MFQYFTGQRNPLANTLPMLGIILFSMLLISALPAVAKQSFPTYQIILKNVRFWEKIYGSYSLREAVIHDTEDLSKVYSVLRMQDDSLPGAKQANKKLRKKGLQKYRHILSGLSRRAPRTREEKRIAALFPKGTVGRRQMGVAAQNIRIQTGQRERFKQGVIASGAYIKDMKRIFRSSGLPEELAYLPHVESSFNLSAYSKFGAAGIWQFTRATGRQYLSITDALDERLDPIAATHAATLYLKNSYKVLGNWPLALTSYNYGLAGMVRAVEQHGSYQKIFKNYRKGHFKFASQNFYSEFLAAIKVADKLEKDPQIQQVSHSRHIYMTMKGYTSLASIALHFNLTTDRLKKLNPALRSPVFKGKKYVPRGYRLRLPATAAVKKRLAAFPTSAYSARQRPSRFHRVHAGETAGQIARKYNISLRSLMRANNMDRYATIYVRQKLKLPGVAPAPDRRKRTVHPIAYITAQKKVFVGAEIPARTSIPTIVATSQKVRHPIRTSSIPTKDPTIYSVYDLYRKNGTTYGTVTVQPEESIELFARWLSISEKNIRHLNKLSHAAESSPGQRLLLSFPGSSPQDLVDKRLDFLQETEDDFFAAFSVVGRKRYKVVPGDTLWDLCYSKFEIPLWLLERYNSTLNLSQLQIDQQLIIPIVRSL